MQQSDPSGHIPPAPASDTRNRPQSTSRRRISDRATTAEQPGASNALTTARILNSPQRASSSREMTPPESLEAVKYTRTGRVSKATKGQRVHHCDECGKTYTRAEHLRRHQQNHKPGAFPCDVPGCGRSFYREDLLTRHKARHDDPLLPPSRQGSPGSQGSAPTARPSDSGLPPRPAVTQELPIDDADIESVGAPPVSSRVVGQQSGTSRTKDRYLNLNELRPRAGQLPIDTGAWPEYPFSGFQQWDPSPPYSPTGYESPTNNGVYSIGLPYFQPQVNSARQSSSASFSGPYPPPHTSRSPVSAGSSTVHLPHWGRHAHEAPYQHLSTSGPETSFATSFGLYSNHIPSQQVFVGNNYSTGVWTPEDRDFMEQDELIVHLSASRSSSMDLNFDDAAFSNEERYLHAYWTWVHPFFAVIHRPSFDIHNASPLLKAAMLALGAQAQDATADKRNGRLIHERCVKVLQKRTLNEWHSFRTSDMQAVVLVEIYSIYKSRRPPLHFSNIFERVYKLLASDPEAFDPNAAHDVSVAAGMTAEASVYMGNFPSTPTFDALCKQRLLMACYMLDVQHATFFGRQKTMCFAGTGLDLPFPEAQSAWDSLPGQPLAVGTPGPKVWDVVDGRASIHLHDQASGYDIFQSMLMMNALCDTNADPDNLPLPEEPGQLEACTSMFASIEQSPRAKLAYHTIKLCKLTPVRDLLAVAGESWVMAEKLSTAQQFAEAQRRSKQWAEAKSQPQDDNITTSVTGTTEPVHKAFRHALKILELYQLNPKTGLLFQEWSIHLASIVIWARAYLLTAGEAQRKPRLSVPQPTEPRMSTAELERALGKVVASATSENVDTAQARSVLLWTKARIEKVDVPHTCGLTNGALDVLGKLVRRGDEDGWFGP